MADELIINVAVTPPVILDVVVKVIIGGENGEAEQELDEFKEDIGQPDTDLTLLYQISKL